MNETNLLTRAADDLAVSAPEIRQEFKFAAPLTMLPRIEMQMLTHPAILAHDFPERRVNNLYFDDLKFTRYQSEVNIPGGRRRLRLRWYGDDSTNEVLLQTKITYAKHRVKKQQLLRLPALLTEMPYTELLEFMRANVAPEFLTGLLQGDRPVMANSYRRKYYANNAYQIRFTIDHDMCIYNQLDRQVLTMPWHVPGRMAIIELKTTTDPVIDSNTLLQHFDIRYDTNSKYKGGMARILQNYPA